VIDRSWRFPLVQAAPAAIALILLWLAEGRSPFAPRGLALPHSLLQYLASDGIRG